MKKILLSLFACVVGFVSFWFCEDINFNWSSSFTWLNWIYQVTLTSDCQTQLTDWNFDLYYNSVWFFYISLNWNLDIFTSSSDCDVSWIISPLDTNYCVQNDLCPVPDNFSQLFINNLEFQSHPVINIEIPDYITWDYTWTESWFNLYIWSWYDVDYINSIIDINSYRPTSEDFTYMFVSGLTLIFPYIFVALLIIFIWKLIKRIFK